MTLDTMYSYAAGMGGATPEIRELALRVARRLGPTADVGLLMALTGHGCACANWADQVRRMMADPSHHSWVLDYDDEPRGPVVADPGAAHRAMLAEIAGLDPQGLDPQGRYIP